MPSLRRTEMENRSPELEISPEKISFIIAKARALDDKGQPIDDDPASDAAVDGPHALLDDYPNDHTLSELSSAINMLNEDEVVDLIALAWLGRGDFTAAQWLEAKTLASQRHRRHSARYLVGIPGLGDYLEEGFAMLGHSCEDFEEDRL